MITRGVIIIVLQRWQVHENYAFPVTAWLTLQYFLVSRIMQCFQLRFNSTIRLQFDERSTAYQRSLNAQWVTGAATR